jgi:hypothetical protein
MNVYRLTAGFFALLAGLIPALALAQEELPPAPEVPPGPTSSSLLDGILSMSNESMIMLVAGVVLSLVWSVVEQQTWSPEVKALGFFLACVLFGVIYSLAVDDGFNGGDIGRRILVTLAAGTVFYLTFRGPLNSLEARSDGWLKRNNGTA